MASLGMAAMLYGATVVLVAALLLRLWLYFRTPVPLRIPIMPAPLTQAGVVGRMALDVGLFRSLFKADKWLWAFGFAFHLALAAVLLRHLRYFVDPVPVVLVWLQPVGVVAGLLMLGALALLAARRLVMARLRVISAASDHLMLVLLAAIAASGLAMKFLVGTDIVAVKSFILGLLHGRIEPLPADPLLLCHLTLVAVLMVVFPFSKLLHAVGVFFAPSRNQADDSRKRRHRGCAGRAALRRATGE